MDATIPVFFDGQVFRPDEPPKLAPNRRYLVTVAGLQETAHSAAPTYPLSDLLAMATDMGRADLAQHHDEYAHPPVEKRVQQGELVALEIGRKGLAGLFGKYRDDPTLQDICDEAYRERDADVRE